MFYKKNTTEKLSDELFKNPTSEYRGTPFWAWNCKMDAEMLGEQARLPAFAVFQELHDDDAAACGEHAKGEAHRRRGLAFAVAMIHVDHTPSSIMR